MILQLIGSRHERVVTLLFWVWTLLLMEGVCTVPHPNAPDRYAGGLNKLNQALLFCFFLHVSRVKKTIHQAVGGLNQYITCWNLFGSLKIGSGGRNIFLRSFSNHWTREFQVIGSKDFPVGSELGLPFGATFHGFPYSKIAKLNLYPQTYQYQRSVLAGKRSWVFANDGYINKKIYANCLSL